MASKDDILATIDRYAASYGADDRAGWLELFTEDATIEDPVGTDVWAGPERRAEFWDFTHSLADRIEITRAGPACIAGHEAAWPLLIVTEIGGTRMGIDAIDVMTFDDRARISGMRAFWDMADMRPYQG